MVITCGQNRYGYSFSTTFFVFFIGDARDYGMFACTMSDNNSRKRKERKREGESRQLRIYTGDKLDRRIECGTLYMVGYHVGRSVKSEVGFVHLVFDVPLFFFFCLLGLFMLLTRTYTAPIFSLFS